MYRNLIVLSGSSNRPLITFWGPQNLVYSNRISFLIPDPLFGLARSPDRQIKIIGAELKAPLGEANWPAEALGFIHIEGITLFQNSPCYATNMQSLEGL